MKSDLYFSIPAAHNVGAATPEQREARMVIFFLDKCFEHVVTDEDFIREYPADEHGRIAATARALAWRYEMTACGRRVIVHQPTGRAQPAITLDGEALAIPDLTGMDEVRRSGIIADRLHEALAHRN
ncbi:hypothetical protein ABZ383_26380 [Streptomyces sp. NPDC005900]|uniref:hypothetical protein n=1 Tax=Streptomyces sp. NPDC005900 TaxID=3154569 RepID=UPI0033C0B66B